MRYFYSAFGFFVFLLALSFGLKNAQPITLHYYLGIAWDAPLILVLVFTFFCGVIAGLLACLSLYVRHRKQLMAMQKELRALESNQE
ncbi:MAG TPA: LapA family protein [Methylophilaceae bacterium]|nr:LapA family protein [Methylophilaceae bacterium]